MQAIDAYTSSPLVHCSIDDQDKGLDDEIDKLSFNPLALQHRISQSSPGEASPSTFGCHSDDPSPLPPTRAITFKFSADGVESTMS